MGEADERAHKLVVKKYPSLSKANGRSSSTFCPMQPRKTAVVYTHSSSYDSRHLDRRKWHLSATQGHLHNHLTSTLHPLDDEALREESVLLLKTKAKDRMLQEGLASDYQQRVMKEFSGVLKEARTGV